MSTVMRAAATTAPINRSLEVLTERLLMLRGEIDAILEQLAGQTAADAAETPAESAELAEPDVADADPDLDVSPSTVPMCIDEDTPASEMAIEDAPAMAADADAVEIVPTTLIEANTDATDFADAVLPEETVMADDAMETVATAEPVAQLEAATPEAIESQPAAEHAVTDAAPAIEAEAETTVIDLDADTPSGETPVDAAQPAGDRLVTDAAPTVEEADETAATVISLDTHRASRDASHDVTKPVDARPNRRYRMKIAACILGGLAVAGLMFADLSALGSAPSADDSASTSARMTPWSYDRLWDALQRIKAPVTVSEPAGLLVIEGYPVSANRYREAWPSGS